MRLAIAIVGLAWALITYILCVFLSLFFTSRRTAAITQELNCEEPPFQRNKLPFGIDNLMRALAADRGKQFPVDMIQRTIDAGAITYRYQVLGATNIATADEKNIQAILSTQFNDFGEDTAPFSGIRGQLL